MAVDSQEFQRAIFETICSAGRRSFMPGHRIHVLYVGAPLQHLHTFETEEEADEALLKLLGPKRLVSDRDGTEVIYKLFGELTWRNLYALSLYDLPELKNILSQRDSRGDYDKERHGEIITSLENISRVLGLTIPHHWR